MAMPSSQRTLLPGEKDHASCGSGRYQVFGEVSREAATFPENQSVRVQAYALFDEIAGTLGF